MRSYSVFFFLILYISGCDQRKSSTQHNSVSAVLEEVEQHRPHFHFSPDSMWMNDPNGMVFYQNIYHLFYQYYPDSTVWGPMHWGHAISTDMITWEDKPIALYPDEHGYIFSGSAVLDVQNTSGFGSKDNPPLVAIYTYHDPEGVQEGKIDYQTQGIAYSMDNGESWTKYDKNPVLKNPGIIDFRDPKIRWFEPANKWIMTLAVKDHIRFYSSPNLKKWTLESEFGKDLGAHGGVWECPDLFPLHVVDSNEENWILFVSINPGGPNGGSATQYFIGDFNGNTFTPLDTEIRWVDYGPDDYAGVTWSNTGERTLFIGWMSNWNYATIGPTEKWRSAMTIARELSLNTYHDQLVLQSIPVPEFDSYITEVFQIQDFVINESISISEEASFNSPTFVLDMEIQRLNDFELILANDLANEVVLSYEMENSRFLIDRSNSGNVSFHPEFGNELVAERFLMNSSMNLKLVVDVASLELFADDGSTVMTAIYFPDEELDQIEIRSESGLSVSKLSLKTVK